MSEWKEVYLDQAYNISSGLSKPASEFGSGFPFLSFKEVFNNFFIPVKLSELVKSTDKERQGCSIKRGDIFLTRTSETVYELGMSCVALKDYENATFNGFTKRLRPNGNYEIAPEYAGYYFRSPRFRAEITSFSSASTRASLNNEMIGRLKIRFPPLEEQKAIASVLSCLDEKIENLRKQNETLEAIAQTLFKHWFIDFEFPNEDGKPYKSSGGEMRSTELGEIPKDWTVGKIEDTGKIICGKTPSKANNSFFDGEIPFIKIPDMHGNIFILNTTDKLSIEGSKTQINKLLPPYCLNVSCIATVGLVTINTKKSHTNQQINSIILHDNKYLEYLFFRIKTLYEYLQLLGSGGTATFNINTKTFSHIQILIPDFKVVNKYHQIVKSIFSKIESNYYQIQTLTKTRDELLPKLMSGQIRVKD